MANSEDDSSWTFELETALIEGCDFGSLRNICKGRPVPDHLRSEVWQICLGVAGKSNALSSFDELFDMAEQPILREDCHSLVENLGNEAEDQLSIVSDVESIITFYCKSRKLKYERDNGWLEVLQPMLALKLSRADLYNCFYVFITRYISGDCQKNGKPFHLFRLLLLYHDPELCSFLDSKRITPDTYALNWLRSLFAAVCDLRVTLMMWDMYFQQSDPFLIFFMALVIIVNARDQIMAMHNETKQEIAEKLATFPSALDADDIEDFCSLAQYYASRTPQSFRRDYQNLLFGLEDDSQTDENVEVNQALCLPVSIQELQQANTVISTEESVHYFVVDCRPAEQYNSGHLPTAFHLDANLMLQNPSDFSVAVQALFATQKQAIAAGSVAGGEHLCFMGSGREEEDQFVHMVVANFLQKNTMYVSVAHGGYSSLHTALEDQLDEGLTDHSPRSCIVCNPEAAVIAYEHDSLEDDSLINKLSTLSNVVKSKSAIVKEKLTNYIKNEQAPFEGHVSTTDRVGRRYRNMASVFSIGDEDEGEYAELPSSDEEKRDQVNVKTWIEKPDIKHWFQCQEVKENGYMTPSYLMLTETHLYILRDIPNKKDMAWVQSRRALGSIVKITSKKRHPELITFKYGHNDEEKGLVITGLDRFLIPKAGEATKVVKMLIMKVLDNLES